MMGAEAWHGGPVGELATCVLAANASPMTLEGTNTWVLHPPSASEVAVIDPGPNDENHLGAVLDVVHRHDAQVSVVLLTHGHADHCDGVARFSELVDCPVRANDTQLAGVPVDEGLDEGDVITVGGVRLTVLATPGHTSDSLSFLLEEQRVLFSGDTVLGRGTSVVAHPDGALGAYLSSLHRLRDLAVGEAMQLLLPGHGPVVSEPYEHLEYYLEHRAERLSQVRQAVAAGARTPGDVVARVYAGVDPELWPAAERSVRAQMDYLATEGW